MLSHNGTVIHTPDGCYSEVLQKALEPLGWSSEMPLEIGDQYLLIAHPITRIMNLYAKAERLGETNLPIKGWFFTNPPTPCSHFCSEPLGSIRIEHYRIDLATMLGLETPDISLPPQKNIEVCLATRTQARRYYAKDYLLGEYD